MRILIIDDNADQRQLLKAFLDEDEVVLAESGPQAFKILALDRKFDLILCDFVMPDIDGHRVFIILRNLGIDIPFAILTSGDRYSLPTFSGPKFVGIFDKGQPKKAVKAMVKTAVASAA